MKVRQIPTGIFIDEKEVVAIELSNDKGNLVKIFNYGLTINQFLVTNAKGEKQDIVLGFDQFEDYLSTNYLENYPYMGTIIGRYGNRIKGGKFSIAGEDYQLAQNNNNDCLHGGIEGFDKKVWDIIQTSDKPHASVTCQYFSLDGEEDFPGDLAVQVTFEFTANDELILTYQADTDEATAINLTHHPYFNLSANGDKIDQHIHQMSASNYLEQGENFVVTGNLIPVEGTMHDFTKAKPIAIDWDAANGYDQTYVVDKTYDELALVSKTTETESGLSLSIYSTQPTIQFYTAKSLQVKNGKNGKDYGAFDAFCIEPQHHPNAVNIPHFPSTILYPEEIYRQTIIYKVGT